MNQPALAIRFDSNRAWQDAVAAVSANRDVLVALAGVFMVLPAFAITVLLPPPEAVPGTEPEALLALFEDYFRENWAAYLLAALANAVGTMAMLALIGLPGRPTVGESIRQGLAAAPSGIAAQILQGVILMTAVLLPATLLALSGSNGLAAVGVALGIALAIYLSTRLALASPEIAIAGQRNPVAALLRSFALTRGNAGRLLLFLLLLIVAFVVSSQLIQIVIGLLAQLIGGAETARLVGALVSSVLQATMSVFLIAALAASHRQLAEPDPSSTMKTFL